MSDRVEAAPASAALGPIDRLLHPFADVRPGEGAIALLFLLNLFVMLAAYYLLKTIREPLILAGDSGGAAVKSYSAGAIAVALVVLVPIYGAVAARVTRLRLINGVTLFFISNLIAFFALARAGVAVGVPFFIWVGVFNLMIIAQLWAYANDVYNVNQGKRLFAIVGFGASLGAIFGSYAAGRLVESFGPHPLLLAAAALLGVCMLLTNAIHRRAGAARAAGSPAAAAEEPLTGRGGFALVLADRYLLGIALLMVLLNLVNTTGEYILSETVSRSARAESAVTGVDPARLIGGFYGDFFTWVNVVAALLQAFAVSRVLRIAGVGKALLVLPVVALGGYVAMAFVPLLSLVKSAKVAENSLDYSLQNTTRNALYLPTSREAKYKAKQATDTFFVRLGDVLSAALVFSGLNFFGFAPRHFALVNVALIGAWLLAAWWLGRRFRALAGSA